jgi:hypothetical protein
LSIYRGKHIITILGEDMARPSKKDTERGVYLGLFLERGLTPVLVTTGEEELIVGSMHLTQDRIQWRYDVMMDEVLGFLISGNVLMS